MWRGKMVRKHFYHLFHTANPPYKIVKHFARLLNFNLEDYHRELELQVNFVLFFINNEKTFFDILFFVIESP